MVLPTATSRRARAARPAKAAGASCAERIRSRWARHRSRKARARALCRQQGGGDGARNRDRGARGPSDSQVAPETTSCRCSRRSTRSSPTESTGDRDWLAMGFRTFKVKVGKDVDADLERVRSIQRAVAGRATLAARRQSRLFARAGRATSPHRSTRPASSCSSSPATPMTGTPTPPWPASRPCR